MIFNTSIDKLSRGCGTDIDVIEDEDGLGDVIICGEYCKRISTGENVLRLCEDCQAQLTTTLNLSKEVQEIIDKLEQYHKTSCDCDICYNQKIMKYKFQKQLEER